MTIKEVCEKFNLSPDTLRYYERAGVIPEVRRTKGGIRDYSDDDLKWVENAVCMRNAGVPVEMLIEYVKLFSTTTLTSKLLPGASGDKKAIDKHHIFPKHYLTEIGYTSDRERNQIANFTYLDYSTNIDISDDPPSEYVARYREKLGEDGYKKTCEENALPENFENLSYPEFLEKRRRLMAGSVRKAYIKLSE